MENKSPSVTVKQTGGAGKLIVLFIFVVCLGVATGAGLAYYTNQSGKVFGSSNINAFKDTAEGTLVTGGIEGEGEYHLVRSGGESQNVYLTSSSVDLSQFMGKKVRVWGQTQEAQKAGWLMDVGRVQVL